MCATWVSSACSKRCRARPTEPPATLGLDSCRRQGEDHGHRAELADTAGPAGALVAGADRRARCAALAALARRHLASLGRAGPAIAPGATGFAVPRAGGARGGLVAAAPAGGAA